nr:hypothetical protein [Tanacetum cinerariifolium]
MGRDTVQLETTVSTISQEYLLEFTSEYGISKALHPELPGPEDRIVDFPKVKVGLYTKFFEFANFRLPLSQFLFDILGYYQIHLSQLSVIGAAKVSHFEINCRVLNIVPTLSLFCVFYTPSFNSGWMSFRKRPGKNTPQCYTKHLDSLKNWNNRFFWVDEKVFPAIVDWRTSAPKDGMPAENTYSPEAVRVLDTHRTPIQKQPEALLCLVGLNRRYYLGDEVYPTFLHDDDRDMDLFNLIRAPNPTKEKTSSRPRAAHEVPLLTVTANRVIEIEDPAAATDSSGGPSTIERSPLDFASENPSQQSTRPEDQETAAPKVPPPEDVPIMRGAPEAGPEERVAATDPPAAKERRKRGHDGVDTNAPPKSRPSADVAQSSKEAAAAEDPESENTSFASMVGSPESIYRPEWGITNDSMLDTPEACQDLYNVNLTRQVAMGSQLRLRFEQEAKLLKKSVAQVARRDKRIQARENEIKNLETLLEAEADMKKAAEDKSVDSTGVGRGLHLAVMKRGEFIELRQAFADVVSAGISKWMSDGLKHEVEHGQANLDLEAIEAYDLEAEAKYIAALQALKNLKYPLVDQLEGLKDAPMDVIMASLHLESDTGDDAPQWVCELRPSSSQLTIPVYPEVRDPMDPWACKEEMFLADAIAANVSRVEKKKKCRVVCRTHGVGSAHHARSDGVSVSVPIVVPQGLVILLADAATVRSKSIAATWVEKVVTPLIEPAIKGFAAASAVLKPERLKVDRHGMSEPMSYYLID